MPISLFSSVILYVCNIFYILMHLKKDALIKNINNNSEEVMDSSSFQSVIMWRNHPVPTCAALSAALWNSTRRKGRGRSSSRLIRFITIVTALLPSCAGKIPSDTEESNVIYNKKIKIVIPNVANRTREHILIRLITFISISKHRISCALMKKNINVFQTFFNYFSKCQQPLRLSSGWSSLNIV